MKTKTFSFSTAFDLANYALLTLLGLVTLYPILNVLAISLSDYKAFVDNPMMIIPQNINLEAYTLIFKNPLLISSYGNTIFIAVVGTAVNMAMTIVTAYPLAKAKVRGERWILFFIIFTMMFSGGLIPVFLVVKNLHLYNTLWALIIPTAISTYNFIIVKTFFESIPDSLEESAKIDGAGHMYILLNIVLPLSVPVIATVGLFYGVVNWNRFFEAVMYLSDRSKWTLTILLREIVTENTDVLAGADPLNAQKVYPKTMQNATIITAVLPILFSYPFVQKYFIKGIMLGAVKQ
ncbi:carbohydrate ABC transporter permease [Paenibacillus thalictri]|uniref:Carbohydrate ABC transporter permease n=1 Tax=Paenibacillus thalictri TaxID=2527873 RepID=A0A4Q9DMC1_9BACL|nr:carbohydrate ABC transporter permease [Paenibacillus thalictri]TBL75239.1 carbohydrate ABC transporter permease [Paenibacillus thalictri]